MIFPLNKTNRNGKKATFAKVLHTLVLGLFMGFIFGFAHAAVMGAASIGISALIYHTLMGILFSYVTLWSGGIEIASVFHSLHNYSVFTFRAVSAVAKAGVRAFLAKLYIPIIVARLVLSELLVLIVRWIWKPKDKGDLSMKLANRPVPSDGMNDYKGPAKEELRKNDNDNRVDSLLAIV